MCHQTPWSGGNWKKGEKSQVSLIDVTLKFASAIDIEDLTYVWADAGLLVTLHTLYFLLTGPV